jgi:DtxR family Mn-dependent transcriptional regulator
VENRSTEDYLKAIYQLGLEGRPVSTTALAHRLAVRSASITGMLQTLARKRLVHYERYRGVSLTIEGRRAALTILRRHRLWEMFLVRFLGYSWDRVHEEAERLEHVTSAELERRLDRVLDFPVSDPHGDPIPSARGKVRQGSQRRLSECGAGSHVVIRRVSDRRADILKRAAAIGLGLDRAVEILEKRAYDGSMRIRLGRKSLALSRELAESVYVEGQRKRG